MVCIHRGVLDEILAFFNSNFARLSCILLLLLVSSSRLSEVSVDVTVTCPYQPLTTVPPAAWLFLNIKLSYSWFSVGI